MLEKEQGHMLVVAPAALHKAVDDMNNLSQWVAGLAETHLNAQGKVKKESLDSPVLGGKLFAPWPLQAVANLEAYQQRCNMHPYTCSLCGDVLVPRDIGWRCPCGSGQKWCHADHAFGCMVPPTGEEE